MDPRKGEPRCSQVILTAALQTSLAIYHLGLLAIRVCWGAQQGGHLWPSQQGSILSPSSNKWLILSCEKQNDLWCKRLNQLIIQTKINRNRFYQMFVEKE